METSSFSTNLFQNLRLCVSHWILLGTEVKNENINIYHHEFNDFQERFSFTSEKNSLRKRLDCYGSTNEQELQDPQKRELTLHKIR